MGLLVPHAVLTLDELKGYLVAVGDQGDTNMELAINAATDMMERRTGRRLATRSTYSAPTWTAPITEYHTVGISAPRRTRIRLSEWPTIAAITVHESTAWPRVYDATSLLVEGTDYVVLPESGELQRISSGGLVWWAAGYRAIQVVHAAGYRVGETPAQASKLPYELKNIALYVAASIYSEGERKRWGVSSIQDPTGNLVRHMGPLPPSIEADLMAYRRVDVEKTWERAA